MCHCPQLYLKLEAGKEAKLNVVEPFLVPIEEVYTHQVPKSRKYGCERKQNERASRSMYCPHVMIAIQTHRKLPRGKHGK